MCIARRWLGSDNAGCVPQPHFLICILCCRGRWVLLRWMPRWVVSIDAGGRCCFGGSSSRANFWYLCGLWPVAGRPLA